MRGKEAFEVAQQLLEQAASEESYRAACSRAYMAVYRHLVRHPRLRGFNPEQRAQPHKLLIEHCKQSTESDLRSLGHGDLPRLRSLRNRADYEFTGFTRALAEEALDRASEVIFEKLP